MKILKRDLLSCLLLLSVVPISWAAGLTSYAFVAPTQAAALGQQGRSEQAGVVLRAAAKALDRAPHAMAKIHVEGSLPGQGIRDESVEALRDFTAARDLALAGRLSGESRFADAAAKLLGSWAAVYSPNLNPIDETEFDSFFIAWDLLPENARQSSKAKMEKLIRAFATGYLQTPPQRTTAVNNWNSHRVKLATLAAFATGDEHLITQAHERFKEQLRNNIDSGGRTYDFTQRDALHYVVYSLEPLLMAALAAQQHGHDWWNDEGSRLSLALNWLRPYASGEKTHIEFAKTTVKWDHVRRDAGLKGFDGMFDRKKARLAYVLAARFDRQYGNLANSLRDAPWQDAWLSLIAPLSSQ
ncbi:MAG: alginate lyase [Betaproteobacteria bacterium]|nr:alginate lyase [Betaproteobacteria bacterium]